MYFVKSQSPVVLLLLLCQRGSGTAEWTKLGTANIGPGGSENSMLDQAFLDLSA